MEQEANNIPIEKQDGAATVAPPEALTRAEFEQMLAEREMRWHAQLEEFKRATAPGDIAAVELRQQPEQGRELPDDAATQAERRAREDKAAQRTHAAAQTRQAVEGYGTTGTLPVNGSAAAHNPIAHITEPRELYLLARHELEQGRKGK